MSRQSPFYHWQAQVVNHLTAGGALSSTQAYGLAILSFGIARAASWALSRVAGALAFLGSDNTVLQRLKYWLRDGAAKRSPHAPQVNVRAVFGPLIRWVLTLWQGHRLVLALDATTLRDKFVVLAVALRYRGTAIPLAWVMLPLYRKQPWLPHWLDLLQVVSQAIPPSYEVLVLADRGLYSPRLYRSLRRRHWHVLLRINKQAHFCPRQATWQPVTAFVPGPGYQWRGRGRLSKKHPLRCTLIAFWGAGQAAAWFLATDLGPGAAPALPYALRVWIEEGFRVLKSLGWQWQQSRITQLARAERLWLALAVATVWVLAYGTWAEDQQQGRPGPLEVQAVPAPAASTRVPEAPTNTVPPAAALRADCATTRRRRKSIFRQGLEALTEYLWGAQRPLRR
jgi:hypothetical protein